MFFYQLTLLSINHMSMSYLSGIYVESRFPWLGAGAQKTLKKEENTQNKNEVKNEDNGKRRVQTKSNNNNKHL